jgi:LysM repeat protein
MAPNSQELFNESNRQNADAGKHFGQAMSGLGSAIADAWQGYNEHIAAKQVRQDEQTEAFFKGTGHLIMGGLRELNAETSDLQSGAKATVVAAAQREVEFDKTRGGIAAASMMVPGVHVLLAQTMGGNKDRLQDQAQADAAAKVHHDGLPPVTSTLHSDASPSATPRVESTTTSASGEQQHHHKVTSGESYWSIAKQQGGTNAEIAARSNHLQALNHSHKLLPGLDIVGA